MDLDKLNNNPGLIEWLGKEVGYTIITLDQGRFLWELRYDHMILKQSLSNTIVRGKKKLSMFYDSSLEF